MFQPRSSKGRLAPALFLLVAASLSRCGGSSAKPTPPIPASAVNAQWEPIKIWSGNGSQYLDSFTSDTGALRIEWEVERTGKAADDAPFRIVMHSAISGRPLAAPIVDHKGHGKGVAYFSEEPRVFFASVTADDLQWKIAISERVR